MTIKFFFKILITAILLFFLSYTAKLNFNLLKYLIHAPNTLVCSILLYFFVIAICAWRWYQLNLVQSLKYYYHQTLFITYLGIAFNNLLPGGIGGDFVRYYFCKNEFINSKSALFLSIFFDRITGFLGIFVVVFLLSLLQLTHLMTPDYSMHLNYILCIGSFFCLSLFFLVLNSNFLLKGVVFIVGKCVPQKWCMSLIYFVNAIEIYRNAKKIIAKCLVASALVQLFMVIICINLAHVINLSISLSDCMLAMGVTQIVNLIPISLGGIGLGESAFAQVLSFLNPGNSAGYATIFLSFRLVGILIYLPSLLVLFFDRKILNSRKKLISEAIV